MAQSTLSQHMKFLHGGGGSEGGAPGKTWSCDYCDYKTPVRKQLTTHIRVAHTHKDLRPYGCPYCPYTCKTSQNTRKHVKRKHPNEEIRWNKLFDISAQSVHESMERLTETTMKVNAAKIMENAMNVNLQDERINSMDSSDTNPVHVTGITPLETLNKV